MRDFNVKYQISLNPSFLKRDFNYPAFEKITHAYPPFPPGQAVRTGSKGGQGDLKHPNHKKPHKATEGTEKKIFRTETSGEL